MNPGTLPRFPVYAERYTFPLNIHSSFLEHFLLCVEEDFR